MIASLSIGLCSRTIYLFIVVGLKVQINVTFSPRVTLMHRIIITIIII